MGQRLSMLRAENISNVWPEPKQHSPVKLKSIVEGYITTFFSLLVTDTRGELTVEFQWKRVRLFDELACTVLFEACQENPVATVEKVQSKPKSKWRPKPLDTVVCVSLVNNYFV